MKFNILASLILLLNAPCIAGSYNCIPLENAPKEIAVLLLQGGKAYQLNITHDTQALASCQRDWRELTTLAYTEQGLTRISLKGPRDHIMTQFYDVYSNRVGIYRDHTYLYPHLDFPLNEQTKLVPRKLIKRQDQWLLEYEYLDEEGEGHKVVQKLILF